MEVMYLASEGVVDANRLPNQYPSIRRAATDDVGATGTRRGWG